MNKKEVINKINHLKTVNDGYLKHRDKKHIELCHISNGPLGGAYSVIKRALIENDVFDVVLKIIEQIDEGEKNENV